MGIADDTPGTGTGTTGAVASVGTTISVRAPGGAGVARGGSGRASVRRRSTHQRWSDENFLMAPVISYIFPASFANDQVSENNCVDAGRPRAASSITSVTGSNPTSAKRCWKYDQLTRYSVRLSPFAMKFTSTLMPSPSSFAGTDAPNATPFVFVIIQTSVCPSRPTIVLSPFVAATDSMRETESPSKQQPTNRPPTLTVSASVFRKPDSVSTSRNM